MAGEEYFKKKWNNFFVYVTFLILFLILPIFFAVLIRNHSITNISDHHPFRSDKAKIDFLDYYERKEKNWPKESESIYADTSYGKTYVKISGEKGYHVFYPIRNLLEIFIFGQWDLKKY